jgi:hypothetical protein
MKIFITLIAIVSIIVLSCSDQTSVTAPEQTPGTNSQLKLVSLPAPTAGISVEDLYTQSMYIEGSQGGTFSEQFTYQSSTGTVSITSKLDFPQSAFWGGKTITQTFNTETASIEFGPSMTFKNPVKYTLTVTGLDLSTINTTTLTFVYVAPDGSISGVKYDYITIDKNTNSITVVNALLDHFSRYGFVN